MSQGHRGCHLIYVLPARAGRTGECFFQFIFREALHDLPAFALSSILSISVEGVTVSEPTSNDA